MKTTRLATIVAAGLLVTLGMAGIDQAQASDPGDAIFQATCLACHGPDGKGLLPGMPDFTKKGGVLSLPDDVLLKRIAEGFQTPGSPVAMPPRGGNPSLTDEQLRQVLAYLKRRFAK